MDIVNFLDTFMIPNLSFSAPKSKAERQSASELVSLVAKLSCKLKKRPGFVIEDA